MIPTEIRHFHLFVGLGGGARGFNRATPRVGNLQAKFRCIGGIDVDPAAIRDFNRLANVQGTVLDLFDRDQYRDFHGQEPGTGWTEANTGLLQPHLPINFYTALAVGLPVLNAMLRVITSQPLCRREA